MSPFNDDKSVTIVGAMEAAKHYEEQCKGLRHERDVATRKAEIHWEERMRAEERARRLTTTMNTKFLRPWLPVAIYNLIKLRWGKL